VQFSQLVIRMIVSPINYSFKPFCPSRLHPLVDLPGVIRSHAMDACGDPQALHSQLQSLLDTANKA
jgi:hypothetical protein